MRKVIFIFLFLFFVSFTSALRVPLDSVVDLQSLEQINSNLDFIKDNYGAEITFIIEDSEDPVTKRALYSFEDILFFQDNAKKWNSLVYYSQSQNKLRFVTYKDCDFVYDYLKQLKEAKFVTAVLDEQDPSDDQISEMFLQISIDFKNTAQDLEESVCSGELISTPELRDKEYLVPSAVLGALYAIDQNIPLEKVGPVLGYYIVDGLKSNFFDFLPFVKSAKEKFYTILEEETYFSQSQIDNYYSIVTKGAILVNSERSIEDQHGTLFHERTHKIMTEELDEETSILSSSRNEFLRFLKSVDIDYKLIGRTESAPIYGGHWQELYAHMAQLEKYPYLQSYDRYIDNEIYNLFAFNYPEAYNLYQKVYDLASD